MIKEFFGWLIAVCRRWAIGSNNDNKTSRAKWGLSLICSLYIMGALLNAVFMIEPEFPSWMSYELFMVLIVVIWIAPLIVLLRVYPKNITDAYIKKYEPKNFKQNVQQQFLVLSFCIGGWLVLFGPFIFVGSAGE